MALPLGREFHEGPPWGKEGGGKDDGAGGVPAVSNLLELPDEMLGGILLGAHNPYGYDLLAIILTGKLVIILTGKLGVVVTVLS